MFNVADDDVCSILMPHKGINFCIVNEQV